MGEKTITKTKWKKKKINQFYIKIKNLIFTEGNATNVKNYYN